MTSPLNKLNRLYSRIREMLKGGSPSVAHRRHSQRRRTLLGLEALETRELLSASVPGFSLSNGNLYNTSTSAQIDTGVQRRKRGKSRGVGGLDRA
jgi:hypothetical protein